MIADHDVIGDNEHTSFGRLCRGIIRQILHRKDGTEVPYYSASVCFNCHKGVYLFVNSRSRRELARCVQDHIALSQAVEYVRSNMKKMPLEGCIAEAFDTMAHEHAVTLGSGKRQRGASADVDMECLFLRYVIHVNWDSKYDTNMLSPRYFDLQRSIRALLRIRIARGSQDISIKTPFPDLQQISSRVRRALASLHSEEEEVSTRLLEPQAVSGQEEGIEEGIDGTGHWDTHCLKDKNDVAQQLVQKEDRFLARRDSVLLRHLQRTLSVGRSRQEAKRRRCEAIRQAEMKRMAEQHRRAVLAWDPHETYDQAQERISRLSSWK